MSKWCIYRSTWFMESYIIIGLPSGFVPFEDGKPAGKSEDFLTGFIITANKKIHGRPVGITELPDGSVLVTDDICNTIWRASADVK